MKILCLVAIIFLSLSIGLPWVALANFHEIQVTPIQRCGLHCVIETIGFDTKEEAGDYWMHYKKIDGAGGHPPYQSKGSDLWFVDYQITESEAFNKED